MINNICLLRCVKYKQSFFLFSPINAGNRGGLQQFSIIQSAIAMETNHSQMNPKEQKNAQFDGKHQISSYLEDLLGILKTHSNPFLVRDVKGFLQNINVGKGEYEIPKHFHPQIKSKVEAVLMVLCNPEQQRDQIQILYQSISSLPEPPNKLWEKANLLISTPAIKSLSAYFAENVMKLLQTENSEELQNFLKQRFNKKDLNQEELETQVKLAQMENDKPFKNLATLICQIIKKKPKPKPSQEATSQAPNSKASEHLSKLENLNKQKTDLIDKMGKQYKAIFHLQLRSIIPGVVLPKNSQQSEHDQAEQKLATSKFQMDVNTIKQLQKELGAELSQKEIIKDVLTQANYKELCNKSQSLSTVNIVKNLSQVESYTQAMKGKDIIAFFGRTGAGKSTSVNYFIGVPLLNYTNHLKQKVVKIDDSSQYQSSGNITSAKIGENMNISETAFSRGYDIIPYKSPHKLQGVMLCDSPGFDDTRGSEMIVSVNMSIDGSIEKCRSIKAIVLVIPFDCFKLDRVNSLVQLIALIQQRFPDVLKKGSSTNQCFHILITKWSNCPEQRETIGELFKTFITEENKNNSSNLSQLSETLLLKQRRQKIEIFQALSLLHTKGRVKFIEVKDLDQRQQILDQYLDSKVSVNKSEYVKAMESSSMQSTFSKQISSLSHTWTENILNNYFVYIPKEIQKEEDNHEKTMEEIVQKQKEIERLKSNLEDKKKYYDELHKITLPEAIKESERVDKEEFTKFEIEEMQTKGQDQVNERISRIPVLDGDSKLKILRYKVDTENRQQAIKRLQQKKQKSVDQKKNYDKQVTDLKSQIKKIDEQIQQKQDGKATQNIYLAQYQLGQIVSTGQKGYSKEERMDYLSRGESFPETPNSDQTYKIGQYKIDTCDVASISKEFVLLPNKQFDPQDYITKSQHTSKYSVEGYQARIDSRNVTLEGVNLDPSGKKITLSMLFHHSDDMKQSSVPYIKVDHFIPKHIYYQDQLRNKRSEKADREQKLRNAQIAAERKQAEITVYENQIITQNRVIANNRDSIALQTEINKKRVEIETLRLKAEDLKEKKALLKKLKHQVVLNVKAEIKRVKGEIDDLIEEIENGKQYLQKLGIDKISLERLIADQQYLLKRYRYLIKDQIDKNVPQSLEEFAVKAYSINESIPQGKQSSKDAVSLASGYLANFIRFKKMYSKYSKDMAAL